MPQHLKLIGSGVLVALLTASLHAGIALGRIDRVEKAQAQIRERQAALSSRLRSVEDAFGNRLSRIETNVVWLRKYLDPRNEAKP